MNKRKKINKKDPTLLTPEESEKLWGNVSVKIQKMEEKNRWKQLGVVVSLLLLFGIGSFIGYDRYISPDVYMAQFSPVDMTLKDGTEVRLLEGSKLTIEKSFPGKTREVNLEGNAIFRVSKSKHSFIVHGEGYDMKILGTIFKVTQDKKAFKLELYEGQVTVMKKDHKENSYILHPGEAFNNYGAKNIATVIPFNQKENSSSKQYVSKLTKLFSLQFKDCRFAKAVAVIDQIYAIKVEFPEDYKDKLVTIKLTNISVDKALQRIALSLRLQLQQNGTTYRLEKISPGS